MSPRGHGDVEAAGISVTGVTEDLVTVDDIAERASVTSTTVRYWVNGDRRPGDFPMARMKRPKLSLCSWAEVSVWLRDTRLGKVDHLAVETANACVLAGAALVVRRGLAELPKHDRPLLAGLVA